MKSLIQHYWRNNWREIAAKSVMHCHTEYLHSVMLSDVPGRRIRIFFAMRGHKLYLNSPGRMHLGLSIGFHPHHCNITLAPIHGRILNWKVKECGQFGLGKIPVRRFIFDSKLLGGKGQFRSLSANADTSVCTVSRNELGVGEFEMMQGSDLHTVYVGEESQAAWMVFEGEPWDDYKPECFSNVALDKVSTDRLYQPFSNDWLRTLLERFGIL